MMNDNLINMTEVTEIEVPFYDVDPMNIVWHGHYVKYMEDARCCLLTKIDYDYFMMKESGYAWPVVDLRVKYIRPLQFKQKIVIVATIVEYENRLKIEYVIRDALTSQVLTKAHTVQVAVNIETNEMCFVSPTVLLEKIQNHLEVV